MKEKALIVCMLLLFAKISHGQYTYNKAASFNGFSSYFSIPSAGKFNLTTGLKIEAWIKPTAVRTMAIVGKNFQTGYYFGLNSSNQLRFYKGNSFVESVGSIPLNVWTHVVVTYSPGQTRFYINANAGTLITTLTGAIPVNSDSLKIGADGSPASYFFQGEIDDVSIWNSPNNDYLYPDLTLSKAIPYPTGIYSGLAASYRLNGDANGNAIYDEVVPYTDGVSRNVSNINYSKNPTYHSCYNASMYFAFNEGYLASPNNAVYNSTTAITLEAWIKKDTTVPQNDYQSIINKSGGTDRNNYNLIILGNTLTFAINNTARSIQYTNPSLLNGRWHHIAATYNSANGSASLYLDGILAAQTVFAGTPLINNDADSLFMGKMGATGFTNSNFTGQMDEVRIWKNTVRTGAQIKDNMFKNIDFTTPGAPSTSECCIFGFDGRTYNDLVNIDLALPSSIFYIRNYVFFITNPAAFLLPLSQSPMLRDDLNDYLGSSYHINSRGGFIPDHSVIGLKDSVFISAPGLVNGLRIFTLIDHPSINELGYAGPNTGIILTSPTGTSVVLTPFSFEVRSIGLMTIFDMTADSTIKFNFGDFYCVAPFSPKVKPANSLAVFNGQQQQGWWKLQIIDRAPSEVGYVHAWGIQAQTPTTVTTESETADKYELSQNYPNPFNPSTKINYKLSRAGFVKISVYDVTGRLIAALINENQRSGAYSVEFNADAYKISSGVYFYKLEADGFIETKKMILLK